MIFGLILAIAYTSQIQVILGNVEFSYSMVWLVSFLRFGKGTLATYGPGSRRIVKFQWTLKVLKPELRNSLISVIKDNFVQRWMTPIAVASIYHAHS